MALCGDRLRRGASVLAAAALVIIVSLGPPARAAGRDVGPEPPGQFDYYVLSLSWVPGFCATSHKTPAECRKGLTFALHGLWPQLNGGNYPSDCSNAPLSAADRLAAKGVFADDSMAPHEWAKHGTCSGLQPAAYFALATKMRQQVAVPPAYTARTVLKTRDAQAVTQAFAAANPGLAAQDISVAGTQGILTEFEVCLTKTGAFRAC